MTDDRRRTPSDGQRFAKKNIKMWIPTCNV